MNEAKKKLLQQLVEIAEDVKDASLLLSSGFEIRHPELYKEALGTFGSWEVVLAQLVLGFRDKEELYADAPEVVESLEGPTFVSREPSEGADDPLWGITMSGDVGVLEPTSVPLTHKAFELDNLEVDAPLQHIVHEGSLTDVTVFSKKGFYYGVMKDLAPRFDQSGQGQNVREWFELEEGDGFCALFPSYKLRNRHDRIIHVTKLGKAKASTVSDFSPMMGKNSREAFLLNEGDTPIAVLIGEDYNGLFCASAMGQGIHMSTQDIRTMGRRSVGVNVMKLAGDEDYVSSAFLTMGVNQVVVVTAQGFGKRLAFREFRKQGRGGAGMQVLRLNPNDHVVGVLPCTEDNDVVLTTNIGRVWRLAAHQFQEMGRSARGKRIFEVGPDEEIIGLSVLPCAGNPTEQAVEDPDVEDSLELDSADETLPTSEPVPVP